MYSFINMERKCSQTIKIPFPIRVFYGTEVTIDIPKSGDIIKNIRLVLDFPNTPNTLGERIIERTDLIVGEKSIEILEGEYIHVENTFTVPVEKYDKLNQLLCVTDTGTMYLEIPFKSTSEYGLYLTNDTTRLRILFANQSYSSELSGHILVDYYLIENPQKFPYVQNVTQIQKFTNTVTTPKKLKMSVYAVGPVYQLYFTVKDLSTNTYVDAITNISLNFGEKERFNLTGQYLRYVEPLKLLNTYATEPMYMYNFCLNPNVPSGSTHFNEKSFFLIDFYDNQSTYEVTIWAKSHDFVYVTEKTIKPIFESTEMLIDTTKSDVTNFQNIPLRVSYINYSGSIVIFFSSQYEISNIYLETSASNYKITQNTIELVKIDSVNDEYTANVTFSSIGFSDTTCYFRIIGNNMYLNNLTYDGDGTVPTHIDLSQNFHYVYGNVFDFSNTIFTSNIQSFTIDDNKNYAFTTFSTGTCNILGTNTPFVGPGSIIAKYDKNMNLLFTVTTTNSNVTELSSGNTYGVYSGSQGTIVSRDYGSSVNTSAGSASVFIDEVSPIYTAMRFTSSSTGITFGNLTTNFGIGTSRCCLASSSAIKTVSSINQVKTSLDFFSNGSPVWAFMYTSSSSGNGVTIPASTNGYMVNTDSWSKSITNITNPNNLDTKLVVDKMTNIIYFIGGYSSTTPSLTGFTFASGTGFFLIKMNNSGTVKYVLSFIGKIVNVYPVMDTITGNMNVSIITEPSSLLEMYNNGVLEYSDTAKYVFMQLDDYGNINSTLKDVNELFNVPKPKYFTPLANYSYYSQPNIPTPDYTYWTAGAFSSDIRCITTDQYNNVYCALTTSSTSNIFDKYGDTKIQISSFGTSLYLIQYYSNCIYTRWRNIRCENVYQNSLSTSKCIIKGNYIYLFFSFNSNSGTVYDINNNILNIVGTTAPLSTVVRFNMNGTFSGWYMIINSSFSHSLTKDLSDNLYICGVKNTTSSVSIVINGTSTVGTIPITFKSYTSWVIKLNSSDSFLWSSYVDGGYIPSAIHPASPPPIFPLITCDVDGSGNVFLTGCKTTTVSNINGSTTNVVPITSSSSAAFVIKLNSSGSYASWYSHIDYVPGLIGNEPSYPTSLNVTKNNELLILVSQGTTFPAGRDLTYSLYINGVLQPSVSLNKINEMCGCLVKYTSSGTYSWHVTVGTSVSGNYLGTQYLNVDNEGYSFITGTKQTQAADIRDKNWTTMGQIQSTIGDAGYILKIDQNGFFSNNYGYMDTVSQDFGMVSTIDRNGDILVSGLGGRGGGIIRYLFIYDKNGYVTTFDNIINTTYSFLLKYNSNMTLNKISL